VGGLFVTFGITLLRAVLANERARRRRA